MRTVGFEQVSRSASVASDRLTVFESQPSHSEARPTGSASETVSGGAANTAVASTSVSDGHGTLRIRADESQPAQ